MKNNKVATYLLYAVGEIFLVVIGILIAVSIDNWNEDNKQTIRKNEYLEALKAEFEQNQNLLQVAITRNKNNMTTAYKLSKLMGKEPLISRDSLRLLVLGIVGQEVQYRPITGVIDDIISSGKLELFEGDSLGYMISGWNGQMTQLRYQENDELAITRRDLMDITLPYFNLKNTVRLYQNNAFEFTKSQLESNEMAILQSLEIENLIVVFISSSRFLEAIYSNMATFQEQMLEKIKLNQTKD